MNISKRVYALGEKDIDKYTRTELSALLEILDSQGIDITQFFLSEEHMRVFQNSPDREKLRQIKQILISSYNQEIRKQIALKLAKQINQSQNTNYMIEGVLNEIDKLLTSICYCLLGEASIEAYLAESTEDSNFFEKILKLFDIEGKSKTLNKSQEIYRSLEVEPEKKKVSQKELKEEIDYI